MYRHGIVVIGYKNAEGIQRLLCALGRARYDNEFIKLIISIDKSEDESVKSVAEAFRWDFGEKHVVTFPKRLGLREHVLHCGDYLNIYDLDALTVFEDDMMPAPNFFRFVRAATEKYINNENIAGISLYTNQMNFNVMEKFSPVKNDGDNFFIQNAQSRGQVWFRTQWNEFREWYNAQTDFEDTYLLPARVTSWPETSWKKYFIKYCVVNNKYYVYPYISYSTCFGSIGTHIKQQGDHLQVQLSNTKSNVFNLVDFDDNALKYDVFMENQELYRYCNVSQEDLLVDLYGDHVATVKKYILTKKKLPYRVINSWGNRLIPHEMNLIHNIAGNDIFLYETDGGGKLIQLPGRCSKKSKMEVYFNILDRWMEMEEQGKSLEEIFLIKCWKRIAIYGYGKIGKHLYHRLKNTSVQVEYFVDQNSEYNESDVKIMKVGSQLPYVDVIIITPVMEYEIIKKCLEQNYNYLVVSVEDLFK